MTVNDFITAEEILAEVLVQCKDEELKKGYTKGWYYSRINDALTELAYDTYFLTVTIDVHNRDVCKNHINIPSNIFNLKEVYLFNGDCDKVENVITVHLKRNFNNHNSVKGKYTAKRRDFSKDDDFYRNGVVNAGTNQTSGNVSNYFCYGNIQHGVLMVTAGYEEYTSVRFVGAGVEHGDITLKPVIPRYFKQCISDFVCHKFFMSRAADDRNNIVIANTYKANMDGQGRIDGSWEKATRRIKLMNRWEREELIQYLSAPNI